MGSVASWCSSGWTGSNGEGGSGCWTGALAFNETGTVRLLHGDVNAEASRQFTISTTRSRNNINTLLVDTFS